DLYLHLGRTPPPVIHVATRLGAVAGNGFFDYAYCTLMGWHAKRLADLAWRMGQGEGRPGIEVYGGGRDCLWHGHIGRTSAVAEKCKCHRALHRLDHSPRAR